MSIGVSEASLSDIAAVTNNRNNDGMFGNDWAWIVILLLFGWGRNGFGGFGGGKFGGMGSGFGGGRPEGDFDGGRPDGTPLSGFSGGKPSGTPPAGFPDGGSAVQSA